MIQSRQEMLRKIEYRPLLSRAQTVETQIARMNLHLMELLVESSGLGTSLRLTRDFRPLAEEPSHGVKVQMYRCTQECISNIIRHSGATEATISLVAEGGRLVLTVTDNGHGFDAGTRNSGIGLRAIAENAAQMGGSSRISSSPEGTRIVVALPYAAD